MPGSSSTRIAALLTTQPTPYYIRGVQAM
jgi:hypothetical protein